MVLSMSDYVISEEMIQKWVENVYTAKDITSEARSRTLSLAIAEHNAGVIKELERMSNLNVGTQYRYAIHQAIALIRGGG